MKSELLVFGTGQAIHCISALLAISRSRRFQADPLTFSDFPISSCHTNLRLDQCKAQAIFVLPATIVPPFKLPTGFSHNRQSCGSLDVSIDFLAIDLPIVHRITPTIALSVMGLSPDTHPQVSQPRSG
jgi:hypothetical protein